MPFRKSAFKKEELIPGAPVVVGTIHSPGALRHALRLRPGAIDFLELRVDHFADRPELLFAALGKLRFPFVLTVRHPAEGGAGKLSPRRRLELYRQFLPQAAMVDVELRSVAGLEGLLEEARAAGVKIIVSDHHFQRTPAASILRRRFAAARRAGAEIVKVAARVGVAADVARLLALLPGDGGAVSVMGMGPLGKAARLLFARAGSALNYGYLGEPQVPGQWPAPLLKERLREVLGDA